MGERNLTPLDPGLLRLMRIKGAMLGLIVVAAALAAALVLRQLPFPPALLMLPAVLLLAYLALWAPGRRYRAWGYSIDAEELHVRRGVWTRIYTVVPLDRVEHIDVSQGPVERTLALTRLVVHTAGTLHSQIVVPGLRRETAERMRDEIRARIARDGEG